MTPPQSPESAIPKIEISFDPEAILGRDPRVLLDPAFLETLHAELAEELDAEQSAAALLQMGFLHGFQDLLRRFDDDARSEHDALPPPLRMPFHTRSADSGELLLEGAWPDHCEASAHRDALGEESDPVCHLCAGYTSGWLSGAFDADLLALETSCSAAQGPSCRFEAREAADWLERGDARAARALAAIPFEAFRKLVRERVEGETRPTSAQAAAARVERGASAVHIWGPVMVLPYAGADETLQALELMARDRGAAEVSVIVLDLAGAIIDETFGAIALEQLVQSADAWGAETLFVDPSPLSEDVVRDLDHRPLLVLKDLEPAIALAFQIARSQRQSA